MEFCCSLAFQEPAHLVPLARAADACGFGHLVLSDHLVHPGRLRTPYPYTADGSPRWRPDAPWPDPWVAVGAMAAVTERVRFLSGVYVLPLRDPFSAAKAIGTAAVLSGNRVTLGIGVGWMEEEFELVGRRFRGRGQRADEMLAVMRKLWGGGMVEHHGELYDFGRLQMSPAPAQPIPIWSGGVSEAALRRVGRLTDGWISDLHDAEELREIVGRLRRLRAEYGRADEPLQVAAACRDAFDLDGFRRLAGIGVTHALTMPWALYGLDARSLDAKREALERFAAEVIAPLR